MVKKEFNMEISKLFMAINREFKLGESALFYDMLKDIPGSHFGAAIDSIIKNAEIYPGTNMIALIRRVSIHFSHLFVSPDEAWKQLLDYSEGKGEIDRASQMACVVLNVQTHTIRPYGDYVLTQAELEALRDDFKRLYGKYSQDQAVIDQQPAPIRLLEGM